MSIDLDAIRARHAEMRRHLDAQDEAEFSQAAVEALGDVPALLAELEATSREAREGLLLGWGPDYTEVEICCPHKPCTWSHTFDTGKAEITIGTALDTLTTHLQAERHA